MLFDFTYESYDDLLLHLLTEENARRYLAYVRWGGYPKCSHCGHQGPCSYGHAKKVFYCGNCHKQFSAATGTIFERTHLPMLKWFKAMFEIANGNISSVRLAKKLIVNQRTAWKVEQKIRQCLGETVKNVVLSNIVEADLTIFSPDLDRDLQRKWSIKKIQKELEKDNDHVKRKRMNKETQERRKRKALGLPVEQKKRGKDLQPRLKKGEKRVNKYYKYEKWVLGIIERGGSIYLEIVGEHSTDIDADEIAQIMKERIAPGSRVITDGGGEFAKVSDDFPNHEKIIHDPWVEFEKKDGTIGKRQVKKFVEDDKHTNTIESMWSHLKRIEWGHHIQITFGHANRYLYEFAFRRNNRDLTDAEKFQLILKSALKMKFPYQEFKLYTRTYSINEEGKEIGNRIELKQAA